MILARPFDAVFQVRRNQNIVAGRQNSDLGFAFKTKARRSGQDNNPFGPRLIVPEPWRTSLAQGDDPFDLQIGRVKEEGRQFLGADRRLAPRRTDCRMRLASKANGLRIGVRIESSFRGQSVAAIVRPIVMDENSRKHRHGEDVGRHESKRKGGDRWPWAKSAHAPANAKDCRAGNELSRRCLVLPADETCCRGADGAAAARSKYPAARNRHRPGEHKCKTRVEMTGNVEKTAHPRRIEHARKRKAEAEDHAGEQAPRRFAPKQ